LSEQELDRREGLLGALREELLGRPAAEGEAG
jgi:hypothetical protein